MYDGRSYVDIHPRSFDRTKILEIVVHPGKGGVIVVDTIDYASRELAEEPVYVKGGDREADIPAPRPMPEIRARERWPGARLSWGVWEAERLTVFLARRDVAVLKPCVIFDIRPDDEVADVLRCLSALRSSAGSRVVPMIHLADRYARYGLER